MIFEFGIWNLEIGDDGFIFEFGFEILVLHLFGFLLGSTLCRSADGRLITGQMSLVTAAVC